MEEVARGQFANIRHVLNIDAYRTEVATLN
jgi:hypothetical protein